MPRRPSEYVEVVDEKIVQKQMNKWRQRKKPVALKDLNKRIDEYFNFCDENSVQPGIEGLAQCIGVSTKTIVRWSNGLYCSPEWASAVGAARQTINAYLEMSLTSGSMPTIAAIFALKATAGWSDQESFDAAVGREMIGAEAVPYATPLELMEKYGGYLEDTKERTVPNGDTDDRMVYASESYIGDWKSV